MPAIGVAPENLQARTCTSHLAFGASYPGNVSTDTPDVLARSERRLRSPSETKAACFGPTVCQELCSFATAGRLIAFPFMAFDHRSSDLDNNNLQARW